MLALKFLHIAAIALWVAGLVYLTAMLIGHRSVRDLQDFARIRLASRFTYMAVVSPAAGIAVAAGAALLFVADALHPWMVAKLIAVGMLVLAHIRYGYVLAALAQPGAEPPALRLRLIAAAVLLSALAAIAIVLAKPAVPESLLPEPIREPGLLQAPESAPPVPHPPPLPRSS
ncbi:MAG: CopD family protein [Pseudomonadota bacterium]|nr:CopD family protein [Pseudomonadota bacterium]